MSLEDSAAFAESMLDAMKERMNSPYPPITRTERAAQLLVDSLPNHAGEFTMEDLRAAEEVGSKMAKILNGEDKSEES